jgi:ribosomal protein L34E
VKRAVPVEKHPEIAARRAKGESLRSIAADFGVSHVAIHYILREPDRPRCPTCGQTTGPRPTGLRR